MARSNNQLARYARRMLALALAAGGVLTTWLTPTAYAQQLPLPTHPGREEVDPLRSMPRAAQPNRGETYGGASFRDSMSLPRPGSPSRDLAPPGEAPEGAEDEDAAPPGLTNFLPHEVGGITAEYVYTGEVFSNARGGISTKGATSYRSNFDLVLTFDTERMGFWEGGRFFLYGQDLHGRRLSQDFVGDYQLFSNLDSTPYSDLTQLSEYWYQHNMYDNQLWFKVGRQDANANFALVDLGGDFVNSSFGLIPTVLLPTFPSPALGTAGFWEINENVQLGGGVYDGAPAGVQSGFNTLGEYGYMSLVQLQIKSQFGAEGQLPSTVRLGAWQHSNQWDEITTSDDPRVFSQNYGIWASFDQLLWKETDEEGDEQGLGAFGQFGWAPGNRNPVQEYYGAGLVYRGLLPERNRDLVGLGMANVLFSPEQRAVGGETFETALEFFYKWYVGDYISLQPDFQYIVNPGGVHRDAVVPGMRFEVVF